MGAEQSPVPTVNIGYNVAVCDRSVRTQSFINHSLIIQFATSIIINGDRLFNASNSAG